MIAAAAAMLSGCAIYQEPSGGATATLTAGHIGDGTSVYEVYKDRSCAPNPAGKSFYTTMGTMGAPTKKIPAGQEFVLTGTWSRIGAGMAYRCPATAAFVPGPGKSYVATITPDMAANRCTLVIEEQVAGGTRPVVSPRTSTDLCWADRNLGARLNGEFDNIKGTAVTITR
jgi:hypothetical protein